MVPPEEKLGLLAKAQTSAVYTCIMFIGVAFTLAIALKIKWLVWISVLASPLLFQSAAHRAWRGLKPKILLEYLAARSVARRFAYAGSARGLDLDILFRGKVTDITNESEELSDAISSIEHSTKEATAWIGLLTDAVVAFSEKRGGGVLEFVSITDKRVEVHGKNIDGSSAEYSQNREIFLTINKSYGGTSKYKITSDYPAALIVFEKKLAARIIETQKKAALAAEASTAS